MLGEPENHFSLTGAALSTGGRTKSKFLSVTSIRTRVKRCLVMRRVSLALAAFLLVCWAPALRAVDPVLESEQAARALKILDAYHGPRPETPPKKLHIAYFTPSDREPAAGYAQRLDAIMEDVRAFYRDGMERLGFGAKTFTLPQGQGNCI